MLRILLTMIADFATDHLLSPILAPEALLARFPKVFIMTGERDPLVDDTVVFAGRLREAHLQKFKERQELGLIPSSEQFDEKKHVETMLIPEISHGFLQFVSVFPEGWEYIHRCSRWMRDVFHQADLRESETPTDERVLGDYFSQVGRDDRRRSEFSDNEDRPLEMSTLSFTSNSPGRQKSSNSGCSRSGEKRGASGRGQIRKAARSGTTSPISTRKSLVKLSSADDLMGRRMQGLTGGLMGRESSDRPP